MNSTFITEIAEIKIDNLTMFREKQSCSYIKDGKKKVEEEYPLSADGIYYKDDSTKTIHLSVHLSNTEGKLVWQLEQIVELVNTYPNYTVYLMGDFNVVPSRFCENSLIFYKKNEKLASLDDKKNRDILSYNNSPITCEFLHHHILFEELKYDSTCKMRVNTAQIDKMFEIASDKIDTIMVLYPNELSTDPLQMYSSMHYFTKNGLVEVNTPTNTPINRAITIQAESVLPNNSSNTISNSLHYLTIHGSSIKEVNISENTFYPNSWLSDHAIIKSTSVVNGISKTMISLNVGGESQTGEKALNTFEFATKEFYDYVKNNIGLPQLKKQIFSDPLVLNSKVIEYTNDQGVVTKSHTLAEVVKNCKKYFSDDFNNCGLRDCQAVNVHRHPSDKSDVVEYYTKLDPKLLKKGDSLNDGYSKLRMIDSIFNNIMNYSFEKDGKTIDLKPVFEEWYAQSKIKVLSTQNLKNVIIQILKNVMHNYKIT
jgi:hypothetical protein